MEPHTTDFKWNAQDYACNATAQYGWANELIGKLSLRGDEHLLDIGCGDGRISAELANRLRNGGVCGIDASIQMVEAAQQSYATDRYPNLCFQRQDARSIELPQQFDIAFSNAALHWVEDHRAVLQGVQRVLKPGGRLLFQMGGHGNASAFIATVEAITRTARWQKYFSDFVSPYFFYDITDYARWLPQHGFTPVRIELIPKTMRHRNHEALKGWFRTTWFPYTDRLPTTERESFINQVIEEYLAENPTDNKGATSVSMVRLEVEAIKNTV